MSLNFEPGRLGREIEIVKIYGLPSDSLPVYGRLSLNVHMCYVGEEVTSSEDNWRCRIISKDDRQI